MNKKIILLYIFCMVILLNAQEKDSEISYKGKSTIFDSTKSNYKPDIKVGNPTNKDVEMAVDDIKAPYYRYEIVHSQPWFDLKKKLYKNTGIQLSVGYTAVFMGASTKIADENQQNAASGIFDATIKWDLVNRYSKNKGSLILWLDSRHLYYGNVAPQFLNFETGAALLSATQFNKWTFRVLEFYYQQVIHKQAAIIVGKIDMADWFNFNTLLHPKKHFTDLAFSVSPTVSWSNPGFGIVAGSWIDVRKRFGAIIGLNDVAGDNTAKSNFFDLGISQWGNGNFLKMVEFFYTPERPLRYFNRLSATVWHSDELLESDESFFTTRSSRGFSLQTSWVLEEKFIPVVTFGMSDGDGANALSKMNISLAHGWFFASHDMLGIGLNYTRSTINDSEAQFLSEIFYRFTWSKTTVITPTVKFVLNPALNPNVNFLFYYGLRARFVL